MMSDDFKEEAKIITRGGIKTLLTYLEKETDFFTAPASTMFHGNYEQGLLLHSLSVYDSAKMIAESLDLSFDPESIAICSLFHDVCKANYYVKGKRNKKIDGKWEEIVVWEVKDQLPMGHGEKSVFIITKYMELTDEEALAIRWHLGPADPGVHFNYPSGYSQKQAFRENPLVALIHIADMTASYLLDEWKGEK
jgi:hypothetical protein